MILNLNSTYISNLFLKYTICADLEIQNSYYFLNDEFSPKVSKRKNLCQREVYSVDIADTFCSSILS